MKIGIILETKEYEKAWNAFRFAVTAKKQGNRSVKHIFFGGNKLLNIALAKFFPIDRE